MKTNALPLVSIIIPHWKGNEILQRCLSSLAGISYKPIEILLVDNGSDDGSIGEAERAFPAVVVLRSDRNLGYAGGCNIGLRQARGEFSLLLNDDAVVSEGFLEPLVECMASDDRAAATQPKIRSLTDSERFDYAGAAGGFLDRYGFPFCRGRIFETVEKDTGQYNASREIFWATGACCLLRTKAVIEAGLLDDLFFAHMEEIDLQWRLRNRGYRVRAVPSSVVRHDAGSTLKPDQPRKVYLNHRNSLMMLMKNLNGGSLAQILPVRIFLDAAAVLYRLVKLQPLNALMIIAAPFSVLFRLPGILRKRNEPGSSVSARTFLYQRSIVWDYYVMGRKTFADLRADVVPHE